MNGTATRRYFGIATVWGLMAGVGAVAQRPPDQQPAAPATPAEGKPAVAPIAVAGFAGRDLAERDRWLPLAVQETLAWRLRRMPGLVVIPTMRLHQARQELQEKSGDPPVAWQRVVPLIGARRWLIGTCGGNPDALVLDVELRAIGGTGGVRKIRLGPGRLFDVLDDATRWVLGELGMAQIDPATEQLVLGPPARSPSAVQYYARALAAARAENLRDAAYYIGNALNYDDAYRPGLMLLAKLELRGTAADRARAEQHLRRFRALAARAGDELDLGQYDIAEGLLLMMVRSFDVARRRFETALERATRRSDPYGRLAAMNSLCDYYLNTPPAPPKEASEAQIEQSRRQHLRQAAQWQQRVLELLDALGDKVSRTPATNKLALIYDRLGDAPHALAMYQRSIEAARASGSARNEATSWLFLGQWYRKQKQWSEAIDAIGRCLKLAGEEAKPRVRITLAETYRAMGDTAHALEQYRMAYAALSKGDDLVDQYRCLRGLAELKMESGDRAAAVATLSEAIDIAEALELPEEAELRKQLAAWRKAP